AANFPQRPSKNSALSRVRLNKTREWPCFCKFAAMRLPMMPKPMNPIFIFFLSSRGRDQFGFVNVFSFDLRDFLIRKAKGGRIHISFHLGSVASTDDSAGHGWITQHPRDRNLTGRTLNPLADLTQPLDQREVLRKPRLLKLDVATPPVAVRKTGRSFSRHRAGQQAGGHWRINDHADLVRSTIRQNLLLNFATD